MLSPKRFEQLEKLIRRCRNDARLFDDTNPKGAQVHRVLHEAKFRLMKTYDAQHRERLNRQFERDYAIDTAINKTYR